MSKNSGKEEKALRWISDYNIERAILSVFLDNVDIQEDFLWKKLTAEMFDNKLSRAIFLEFQNSCLKSEKLDFLVLLDKISRDFVEYEVNDYFTFTTFTPEKELLDEYILSLKKTHKRRELNKIIQNFYNSTEARDNKKLAHLKSELENFEFDVEDEDSQIGTIDNKKMAEDFEKFIDLDEELLREGIPLYTGYKELDRATGWFDRGNMVVLGARPSVGKSMAMINIMESMHENGYKVMYFSQEMYAHYVYHRIISRNLEINSKKFKDPSRLTESEKKEIKKYMKKIKEDTNRHVYYNDDMSCVDIFTAAKQVKQKYWLDAIFIDYLGKIEPNSRLYKGRSTNEIVTEVSKQIFRLWKALNVVVFTASQLSRAGEKNNTSGLYRPKTTDLRDSGSIEQDADIIFGLTMDTDAKKQCLNKNDSVDYHFIGLKNRNGGIADVIMKFHPTIGKLKETFFETPENKEWVEETPNLLKTNNTEILNLLSEEDELDKEISEIFNKS